MDDKVNYTLVGAFVLVHGTRRDDGSVDATVIAVKRPAQSPRACDFAVLHLEAAEGAPEDAEGVVLTRLIVLPNGKNINPAEIEAKLVAMSPAVAEAGVGMDHRGGVDLAPAARHACRRRRARD